MTSLRAISTLQRKTKVIVLLLLIPFLSFPLMADSYRIAVCSANVSYEELFSSVLSSFSVVESRECLDARERRREREAEKEEAERITGLSREGKWEEPEKKEEERPDELEIEKVSVDLSPYFSFLSAGDEDALSYILNREKLDAVFCIDSVSDGEIDRINLLYNGKSIHTAWYSSAMLSAEEEILHHLLASIFLDDDYCLYRLVLSPENASVSLDGKLYDRKSDYIVLENGEHVFSLASYGYRKAEMKLTLDGTEEEIELSLEPDETFDLFISTLPYDAEIYLNGKRTEERLVRDVFSPYTVALSSPRFDGFSFQERQRNNVIKLEMEPLWRGQGDILEEKKGAFYSSLFYLLISFGGWSASSSVSVFVSPSLGEFSKVVFTGASIVSLVNLVRTAVDYYNTASSGRQGR